MVEGVRIEETGNKKWSFDYGQGDVKALYKRGDWHNWQEEIGWLQQYGERDNELTPGETVAMCEDLRSLMKSGVTFTNDPGQAYKMAHKLRAENNRRHASEHAEAIREAQAIARASRQRR